MYTYYTDVTQPHHKVEHIPRTFFVWQKLSTPFGTNLSLSLLGASCVYMSRDHHPPARCFPPPCLWPGGVRSR